MRTSLNQLSNRLSDCSGEARLPLLDRTGPAIHGKDGNDIVGGSLSGRAIAEDRSPRVGQEGSEAGSWSVSGLQSIRLVNLPIQGAFVSGASPFARRDLAHLGLTHLVHESF